MSNVGASDSTDFIAIIGMTGRFPGARNTDEFWQNLRDGVESIKFFTPEELATSGIDPSLLKNPKYVRADGVVDDTDLFDAEFFNFTPREAEFMDPQHRMFLECAWEVMESAGYDSESYDGRVGVYAASGLSSYLIRNILSHPGLYDTIGSFQIMLGNGQDFLATRVSHQLNLKGPSINAHTLCSSSFVAIHLACQGLLNYQCDLAIAGGVSLQVSRNEAFFYQEGGIGDPTGHCRAFDANARGTVSGSGLGIVVLKRLEEALADGDYIHAVIKGSAVNNDGSKKISYTAPSVEGQAGCIAEALSLAGVDPGTITYVETHGTGTVLGDPIEIAALTQVFRASTQQKGFCAIGSVKTNIGHLVTAGGVASLIKTVLAMQHQQIPPSLNFETPNPKIDFANSPFYVATRLTDWKTLDGIPRRAGVSSFGIGGTNVHLVVEEAPEPEPSGEGRPWQLLMLSAKTGTALDTATANLTEYLKKHLDANLADVAYTLHVGRRAFEHRRMLLCRDLQDAIVALDGMDSNRVCTQFQESRNRPVTFMFPGSGEQCVNIGLELYQSEPAFRDQVDHCADLLKLHLKLDLRRVLYPGEKEAQEAARQLGQPVIAQAALFVIEYALAQLWLEWGIRPQGMIGEGVGEYVAACLAGVLSVKDALELVVTRGRIETNDLAPQSFADLVTKISLNAPQISFVSSATGAWITKREATDPKYWSKPPHQTMHFVEAVQQLLKEPEQVLLQVGPGQTLTSLILKHPSKVAHQVVLSSMRQRQDGGSDVEFLLATLGRLWLAGVQVKWSGFYTHEQRHRIPLPTYPFERRRYWLEPYKSAGQPAAQASLPEKPLVFKRPEIEDWFYIPSWKCSLPAPDPTDKSARLWLVFVDECGLGAQLVKRLEREGQTVITVKAGSEFARLTERTFVLDPGRRDDYDALLDELSTLEERPQAVVHLWSVAKTEHELETRIEERDQAQDLGFYSLLFLSQALGKWNFADDLCITVVSNSLQAVTGDDVRRSERATVLGPIKVIPQEYPNIACRNVDVVLPKPGTRQERKLVDHLWAELVGDSTDPVVAYRGNRRWVQTFEPVQLKESIKASSRLREGGVYLITGGLEGIGFVLAEHLARTCKPKLILAGDSNFPARDEWKSWLSTHDKEDPVTCRIRTFQELETLGTQIWVAHLDVTDRQQMQAIVAQAQERWGQLNGVIHAAGNFGQAAFHAIEETDKAECEQQLHPTLHGALVLQEVLSEKELDFCLLVSSLSSVLGGLGLVAYSAANNFIDAFAHQSRPASSPWISLNWDSWELEPEHKARMALSASLDELAITPAQGVEALERILSCGEINQLVVSTADLQARLDRWIKLESIRAGGKAKRKGEPISFHPRPSLLTPFVAPRNETEQILADIWQRMMGIEQIGIHDDFFELGGHSLLATQIMSRVRETFKIDLPLTNLFQQPTIAFLGEYIETIRWAAQAASAGPVAGREEVEL